MMKNQNWDTVIEPKNSLLDLRLKEIWRYRDLLVLFVRRDFVAIYKQTILGPLWFFIQPVLTTIIFSIIFGVFANISTDGAPRVLFYLGGLSVWNYFADSLTKTSETFIQNQNLFGKVYFPRLVVPISIVISNLLKFFIQFSLFIFVWIYFLSTNSEGVNPNSVLLLFPLLVILTSILSLSFGILFSALTTKYRDMRFLLQFGVQLFMYVSSVVIPLSEIPVKYQWIFKLNPLVPIIESFKFGFLGTGLFNWVDLLYSTLFTLIFLIFAVIIFNRVERSFMDTV
jgi:lipopolysaccharide transport system permease protein